jgi:ABC-type Fe3+ transport system permease subunit
VTAWVILIGFAIAVVGVIVKVGVDVARDLREDREAHGGRQTRDAAWRALMIGAVVAVLVLVLIVWPLILGDD